MIIQRTTRHAFSSVNYSSRCCLPITHRVVLSNNHPHNFKPNRTQLHSSQKLLYSTTTTTTTTTPPQYSNYFQTIDHLDHHRFFFDSNLKIWHQNTTTTSSTTNTTTLSNDSTSARQSNVPQTVLLMCKIRNADSLMALAHMAYHCIHQYRLRIVVECHVLESLLQAMNQQQKQQQEGQENQQKLIINYREYIYTFNAQDSTHQHLLKQKIDYMICAGGDGTILYLQSLFDNVEMPPLLPFVIGGSLGFLLHHDLDKYRESIDSVMNNELSCTRRMRLQVDIFRDLITLNHHESPSSPSTSSSSSTSPSSSSSPPSSSTSSDVSSLALVKQKTLLNEVCVHRGSNLIVTPVTIKSFIDDSYWTTVRGDGIIVSTPTGSTGYNLSANGPMIHPGLDCVSITPICPNIPLSMRPVVLPANVKCRLEIVNREALVSFDSSDSFKALPNDHIIVSKSPYSCVTFDSEYGVTRDWMTSVTKRLEFNFQH